MNGLDPVGHAAGIGHAILACVRRHWRWTVLVVAGAIVVIVVIAIGAGIRFYILNG